MVRLSSAAMTTKPLTTADVPTGVLMRWLAVLQPDAESACIYRRELDRRMGERNERITLREAAHILGVPERFVRRCSDVGTIRAADEYMGQPRYWRSEIERWARWSAVEALPHA